MSKTYRRVISVDIDGTLCNNCEWWKGDIPVPNQKAIDKVNALYDKRDYIIIHTSRRREDEYKTREWLHAAGVRYHILVMDKLWADVYLDDKALNVKDIDSL